MAEKTEITGEDMLILPPVGKKKSGKTTKKSTKNKVGRPLSIKTPKALEKAIDKYFDSISCIEPVRDALGNIRTNMSGEFVERVVYFTPPNVLDLCIFLGIEKSTWENYCDEKKHPEFHSITERTKLRFEAYLANILVTREKGSVRGIMFNLQNNYGWKEKKEVDIGKDTREDLSKNLSLTEKLALIKDAVSGDITEIDTEEEAEEDGEE